MIYLNATVFVEQRLALPSLQEIYVFFFVKRFMIYM